MLLVADVGNTQTHFGTYRGSELVEHWRFATVPRVDRRRARRGAAQPARAARGRPRRPDARRSSPSTVPQLAPEWQEMARRYLGHEIMVVGPGIKTGMPIRYDNPREIGADRLVNAVAGYDKVGGACIVVDFGTAITYDPVSGRRRVPRRHHLPGRRDLDGGAVLARGQAAARSTSRRRSTLIGKSTIDAIRSGLVYGFAGQVDGIVGAAARRARRGDRRRSPPAAWPSTSSRTATRSTRSTSC